MCFIFERINWTSDNQAFKYYNLTIFIPKSMARVDLYLSDTLNSSCKASFRQKTDHIGDIDMYVEN